jgi:transketolase N-terminal domain/subunit
MATVRAPDEITLRAIAARLRGRVIEMSYAAQAAHLGSALSCCDILAAAYWHALRIDPDRPDDPLRDRFILSKGHAAAALYAALAFRGFFDVAVLDTYCQNGGKLAEHPPAHGLPGVEAATGSLGHGLPIGAEVDGHDVVALARCLAEIPARCDGRPVALIGHTVKGKGVSFMEDDNNWHYRAPTFEEVRKAHQELGLA